MSILTLYPYRLGSNWVFDDARTGLKEEAFVCGATEMISRIVETKAIPDAVTGFAMHFSDEPFEGHDAVLHWLRSDNELLGLAGNWYTGEVVGLKMDCWLCPALTKYFQVAPRNIYVGAGPLPPGITPIWDDGSSGTRFVGRRVEGEGASRRDFRTRTGDGRHERSRNRR